VLITGCSSGIGRAAAKLFTARDWNVIATMRSPEKAELLASENLLITRLDVQDRDSGMAAKRMATADDIARVIYGAATDGTNRLRYFCGEDTGCLVKARREMPEEQFVEFMRSRFSAGKP
jgi:NAD(P)-dependent dehydrogenase (short-subunit alcohol dehydrogenase family)